MSDPQQDMSPETENAARGDALVEQASEVHDTQLPVLIIVHQEHSSPGKIGHMLRRQGHRLDIRRPRYGEALPETLERHAGAVIFGGPMSANDDDPYIRKETDWIDVALREDKPFLGICLGAQMLARHLGGTVGRHPQGMVERGYYPIRSTAAGAELADWPSHVYQWHSEGFTLPSGADLMAIGDLFANQAFRYGPRAYGMQFHPEMTRAMLHGWLARSSHMLGDPGALRHETHLADYERHRSAVSHWLRQFLGSWLGYRVTDDQAARAVSP